MTNKQMNSTPRAFFITTKEDDKYNPLVTTITNPDNSLERLGKRAKEFAHLNDLYKFEPGAYPGMNHYFSNLNIAIKKGELIDSDLEISQLKLWIDQLKARLSNLSNELIEWKDESITYLDTLKQNIQIVGKSVLKGKNKITAALIAITVGISLNAGQQFPFDEGSFTIKPSMPTFVLAPDTSAEDIRESYTLTAITGTITVIEGKLASKNLFKGVLDKEPST